MNAQRLQFSTIGKIKVNAQRLQFQYHWKDKSECTIVRLIMCSLLCTAVNSTATYSLRRIMRNLFTAKNYETTVTDDIFDKVYDNSITPTSTEIFFSR